MQARESSSLGHETKLDFQNVIVTDVDQIDPVAAPTTFIYCVPYKDKSVRLN